MLQCSLEHFNCVFFKKLRWLKHIQYMFFLKRYFSVLQKQTSELTGVNTGWQTIKRFQKLMHHNCWVFFQTFNVNISLIFIFFGGGRKHTNKQIGKTPDTKRHFKIGFF